MYVSCRWMIHVSFRLLISCYAFVLLCILMGKVLWCWVVVDVFKLSHRQRSLWILVIYFLISLPSLIAILLYLLVHVHIHINHTWMFSHVLHINVLIYHPIFILYCAS